MTKRDAFNAGREIGREIVTFGDFTEKELATWQSFMEACNEISENRKQYAGEPCEDFRRDSEWEGYEDGLTAAFSAEAKRLGLEA